MCRFLCGCKFLTSLGKYIPESVIVGSYGQGMFSFVGNCQILSPHGCTMLFYMYEMMLSVVYESLGCFVSSLIFVLSVLWILDIWSMDLIVVLICVTLMTPVVEHLFRCFSGAYLLLLYCFGEVSGFPHFPPRWLFWYCWYESSWIVFD